jgi:hypothetical protein
MYGESGAGVANIDTPADVNFTDISASHRTYRFSAASGYGFIPYYIK